MHNLHKGRGIYVILHVDRPRDAKGRVLVDTFMVGQDIVNGEDLQWVVAGGKFKATFLIPDEDEADESMDGLLISETVIPGFEYADHDFLRAEEFVDFLDVEQQDELKWLLKPEEQARLDEARKAQAGRRSYSLVRREQLWCTHSFSSFCLLGNWEGVCRGIPTKTDRCASI